MIREIYIFKYVIVKSEFLYHLMLYLYVAAMCYKVVNEIFFLGNDFQSHEPFSTAFELAPAVA